MLSPGSDSAFHREISKHFPKCSGLFSLGYRWGNEPQKGSVTCLKSPGRAAAEPGLEPTNSAAPGTALCTTNHCRSQPQWPLLVYRQCLRNS